MKNNPNCIEKDNCDKTCTYCKNLNEESNNTYLVDEAYTLPKHEFFDYWQKIIRIKQ